MINSKNIKLDDLGVDRKTLQKLKLNLKGDDINKSNRRDEMINSKTSSIDDIMSYNKTYNS